MAVKPSIPKGTRDFSPAEVGRRKYISDILRDVFHGFGFQPIETPSFENLDTLTGKYGEEGDRLIFKILRSGDFLDKIPPELREQPDSATWGRYIADKAMRYDLTVPFARYVVQHQNELVFPFKRYQIQPVWRADRPQKGRFREFWQCDADAIGSESLWQEVEFIQLYDRAFARLGLPVHIHVNNRKVLAGIAEVIGAGGQLTDFTVALDKLDKIGAAKVIEEMISRGIPHDNARKLESLFGSSGGNDEALKHLDSFLSESPEGQKGIAELRFVLEQVQAVGLKSSEVVINLTLARGLDYYTGAIFEVKTPSVDIGSVGGGGRYDNLTGVFGLPGMSGIGVSFGLDRIYLCLEQLNLFPNEATRGTDVLFFNLGEVEMKKALELASVIRDSGLTAECYPEATKFRKQFDYAEKKGIRYAAIIGETELAEGMVQVKDLQSGIQHSMKFADLPSFLKDH